MRLSPNRLTVAKRPAALLGSLGLAPVAAEDILSFVGAHPQMSVGIVVGVITTFVVHAVRRIKRLITTVLVMALCGGGVANSGATDLAAHFAHNVLSHLH